MIILIEILKIILSAIYSVFIKSVSYLVSLLNVDKGELSEKLSSAGFKYDEEHNQFI